MNLIKQYGLERTGTNYLKALIELNIKESRVLSNIFGLKHDKYSMDKLDIKNYDPLQDKNVATDLSREEISKIKDKIIQGKVYFTVSFKDPYSWVISYNRCDWLHNGPLNKDKVLRFMDKWNTVNRDWLDKIIKNKTNSMGVLYEDLLLNPKIVINNLAKKFNFLVNGDFIDVNKEMKPGIDVHGSKNISNRDIDKEKYCQYYKNKIYMREIHPSLVNVIENSIDYSVLSDIEALRI
jgi:hypothetical protein